MINFPSVPRPIRLSGFALIEMIGVIAIMAILAGAMAPFLLNQIDNTEADAEQLALEAIAEGVRQFYLDETTVANYGNLPGIAFWTAADLVDDDNNWPEQLVPGYLSGSIREIAFNNRDIARFYEINYADFSAAPRVTLLSHLLVGGAAPTGVDAACVGAAQAVQDPCGDSVAGTPATLLDDMPTGIANGLIKAVNLNLGEQRQAIISKEKRRFLKPAAAAFANLPNDVCQGIATSTNFGLPTDLFNVAEIMAANPNIQTVDSWGVNIRINKFVDRIVVWSEGPLGLTAIEPPVNPLFVTVACASGSDLDAQFESVFDAIIGYAADQSPIALPIVATWNADIGMSAADIADPWGNAINYALVGNTVTLTSDGPDAIGGNGDDIDSDKSANEFTGLFANMGLSFDVAEPVSPVVGDYADCSAVDGWMSGAGGCETALGYLTNASECNVAIVYDQECSVAGY